MFIESRLSAQEVMQAAIVGVMRQVKAVFRNSSDLHGARRDQGWQLHIEGACGELAAAKALGLYWSGSVDTFKREGDLGDFEIRTRSRHDYDLIVRKDDADDALFILVTGIAPEFLVRGWIRGIDAKSPQFLAEHGGREPAFFVPVSELKEPAALLS